MNSGERERERARERKASSSPVRRSPVNPELQSTPIARTSRSRELQSDDRAVDHDLTKHRADRDLAERQSARCFARSCRRSRSRLRADRDLAKHYAVEPSRASITISPLVELASRASIVDDFFSGFCPCFSGFVFSFFFSKHQKILFGNFFEMQPNT